MNRQRFQSKLTFHWMAKRLQHPSHIRLKARKRDNPELRQRRRHLHQSLRNQFDSGQRQQVFLRSRKRDQNRLHQLLKGYVIFRGEWRKYYVVFCRKSSINPWGAHFIWGTPEGGLIGFVKKGCSLIYKIK